MSPKEKEDFENWLTTKPSVTVEGFRKLNLELREEIHQMYLKNIKELKSSI